MIVSGVHSSRRIAIVAVVVASLATACSGGSEPSGAGPTSSEADVTDPAPSRTVTSLPDTIVATSAGPTQGELIAQLSSLPAPEGTPVERIDESQRLLRQLIVAELDLADVLTPDVFAVIDEAITATFTQGFPGLSDDGDGVSGFAGHGFASPPGSPGVGGAISSGTFTTLAFRDMYRQTTSGQPEPIKESNTSTQSGASVKIEVDARMEGRKLKVDLTVTATYTVDGQTYVETAHIAAEADVCPDADGMLSLDANLALTISGAGKSVTKHLGGTAIGQVGDDAYLKSVKMDVSSDTGNANDTPLRFGYDKTATNKGDRVTGTNLSTITKLEAPESYLKAPEGTIALSFLFTTLLTDAFAESIFSSAQESWRNGGCVVIDVPEGTEFKVSPHESVTVTASVVDKWDGSSVPAPVTADLTGKGAIVPGRIDPAPDTFVITLDAGPSVEAALETVSRRGRDTESVKLETSVWIASSDGGRISITGTVTDITAPFSLNGVFQGGEAVLTFVPADAHAGSYTFTASGSGATGSGEGSYTLAGNEGEVLTLTYTGSGCVVNGFCSETNGVVTLTPQDSG